MSAKQFREYADECLSSAKTANSDKDRRSFLQMAEIWLKAAAQYEKVRSSFRTYSKRRHNDVARNRTGAVALMKPGQTSEGIHDLYNHRPTCR